MLGIGMGMGMFSSANAAATQNAGANDPQHVICVRCKFCATVLAVNVPLNSMMEIVSVTCGHCTRLLSVDMSGAFDCFNAGSGHTAFFTHNQNSSRASSSSLRSTTQFPIAAATELTEKSATTARDGGGGGAEKRQRVPSAYNQFIREEIQRIKAANPGISHKEAFSAAAKNWAHLGLMASDDKKTETASSSAPAASAPAATC